MKKMYYVILILLTSLGILGFLLNPDVSVVAKCNAVSVLRHIQGQPCSGDMYVAEIRCDDGSRWAVTVDCNGHATNCWEPLRTLTGVPVKGPIAFSTTVQTMNFCVSAPPGSLVAVIGHDSVGNDIGLFKRNWQEMIPYTALEAAEEAM